MRDLETIRKEEDEVRSRSIKISAIADRISAAILGAATLLFLLSNKSFEIIGLAMPEVSRLQWHAQYPIVAEILR